MRENSINPAGGLHLRPAGQVMQLERLGSLHASRLSFVRTLVRQMARQRWQISCTRFDLDAQGHGTAVYRLQTPTGATTGSSFTTPRRQRPLRPGDRRSLGRHLRRGRG